MRRPRELSRFRAPWALVAALVAPLAAADGGADPAPAAPPNVVGSAVDPWAELDRDLERPAQRLLRRPEEAAAPAERPLAPRARGWMRTGGALAGVVALILLLAWSLRAALLGNLTIARGRRPGMIEVLSRAALSAKQSVCLVRVGPRLVLVGVSSERLCALDVIADERIVAQLSGEAQRLRPESNGSEFERLLQGESREYERLEETPPEPGGSAARILRVKDQLRDALRRAKSTARGA